MHAYPAISQLKPIDIKISTVVAVSAVLHASHLPTLKMALEEMVGEVDDFFDHEFVVLDVAGLDPSEHHMHWPKIITLFKQYRLNVVAVRNAHDAFIPDILKAGLCLDVPIIASKGSPPALAVPKPVPPTASRGTCAVTTLVIDTPVRAGQRVYAKGDLIVTATVNSGAEILADGHIHVYASLRGRALAGASGDTASRIFVSCMQAELVSIAGIYRTFEQGFTQREKSQPVQICLTGDWIDVLPLSS